jgi:hypothetical protein
VPQVPRDVTALEFLHAQVLPDLSGWWVYALEKDHPVRVAYAGQSAHGLRRLADQVAAHGGLAGDGGTITRIWLIPCDDQAQADLFELMLIRFYDPPEQAAGRREDLERQARNSLGGLKFAHEALARRRSLDRSQEEQVDLSQENGGQA